jgi:hypothetical protein
MSLFDDRERNYTGYRAPQESNFAFLNRSALPKFERTRTLLENWFHDYPSAHQAALDTGFRSNEDTQHWGAFFELYSYTLLRRLGFTASVQVVVDVAVNRPIDFLVQKDDTPLFYLESTVATGAKAVLANQRKIWELIGALNVLNEPYFQVSIGIEQESIHNLPLSQIRSGVHQWLQTLDPDQVSEQRETLTYDQHPHCSWERDGWKIDFFAIPRPPEDRGTPGETVLYHMWNAQPVEAQNSLRNALESKANRYGVLQLPYVIAVDVLAIDSLGSAAGEVLFGKEVILFNTQSEEITLTRSPFLPNRPRSENGLWTARRRPRNRQISAVLLVDELMAWSVADKTPILWHNPWAEKPLSLDLWHGPQMIPDMSASPPRMQFRDGKKGFEFLNLYPEWPDESIENEDKPG